MNRFVAIVALLSFAAFGDAPGSVTKTRLGSLHPWEGLVVTDIDLSSIGGGITTNDVCNIVTNDVVCGFSDWEISGEDYDSHKSYYIEFHTLENHPETAWPNCWKMEVSGYNDGFYYSGSSNPDAIDLSGVWTSDYGFDDDLRLSVVRKVVKSNALGLARLKDICDFPTKQGVTNIVRDLSLGGIWDAELQVWWTPRMRNGSLTYEATTNVNLNAEN